MGIITFATPVCHAGSSNASSSSEDDARSASESDEEDVSRSASESDEEDVSRSASESDEEEVSRSASEADDYSEEDVSRGAGVSDDWSSESEAEEGKIRLAESEPAHTREFKPKPRRCTDLFCLALLPVFGSILYSSFKQYAYGRPERLTRGFDYRSRLCGMDTSENATFLLWCAPHSDINWADPICVASCPKEVEEVMCPLPKEVEEAEMRGENGTLTVLRTVSQNLVPARSFATRAVWSYCLPENDTTRIFDGLLAPAIRLLDGLHRWKLTALATCFAVVYAYMYLLLLRFVARPLIYASFVLIFLSSGVSMMYFLQKSGMTSFQDFPPWPCDVVVTFANRVWHAVVPHAAPLELHVGTAFIDAVHSFAGRYAAYILFSLGIANALLCVAVWMLRKKTVVEEACAVLFAMKMLLVLPFLLVVAWGLIAAAFGTTILRVLATVPMTAHSITISGVEVHGVGRFFHPTMQHIGHIALWTVGWVWMHKMVHVLLHFAASYAATQWVLSPRKSTFMVWKGLVVGVTFHLGSIALVACISAGIQALGCVALKRDYGKGRIRKAIHGWVRCCESLLQFVSSYTLIEMAINGDRSFCASASTASSVLAANVSATATLHSTKWLSTIVGMMCISAATAVSMVAAINHPYYLRELKDADVNVFAIVGAVVGGAVGYAFMALLGIVSESVMYCRVKMHG